MIGLWWRQVWVMMTKELRQLARDRALMVLIVYIFTLDIYIGSSTAPVDLHHAPVLVHDADHSAASRDLIYRFQPPYFRLLGEVQHTDAAIRLLDRGTAKILLDIPAHFAETLRRGEQTATVQVLVDTSMVTVGYLASSYSTRIGATVGREWAARTLRGTGTDVAALPAIDNQRRIWYNPDLNEAWFNGISELLSMITVACILLPAAALVREKERGTIEQLLVSPLTPLQVMFAKVLAMLLVMLTGTAVSLFGIMQPLFAVPMRGSPLLFFVLIALYAFTTVGLGLVVATFARSSGQMALLVLLLVMPIIMLSGTWTLLESMPAWLRHLMFLSPLRHFIAIAYGILLRGAGLPILWDSVLVMALLGSVLFAVGVWRFRRQFA
jgi:ABC-2 type transport system permease protein